MPLDRHEFDKWAGSYDEGIADSLHRFPFIGYYDALAAVKAAIRPHMGMRVLDIGIGTGLLSEELHKEGCVIHGIDFSFKMLDKAIRRVPSAKLEQVDISKDRLGPFNGQKFDAIVSSYVLHHLEPKHQAEFIATAVKENLSPGGRLAIADIAFENPLLGMLAREKYGSHWDDDEHCPEATFLIESLGDQGIKVYSRKISECCMLFVCSL